jgi:uncharacterized membrane protein
MRFSLKVAEQKGAKVELFSEMELNGPEVLRSALSYLLMALILMGAVAACLAPVLVMALLSAGAAVFSPQTEVWKAFIGPGLLCILLAFVVALYLGLSLSQMVYASIHQGLEPVAALRESWRLSSGAKGGLFLLALASFAVVVAGTLCLLVGLIPALMVVTLAQPAVYLSLLEQSGPRPDRA